MSNQQLARQEQIKTTLFQQAGKQITALLNGDKERANKFMAASMVIASDNSLRNCTPESIVQSLVGVAMLDLSIDKTIGHCYLVPYKDSVQLQIGYKGMIQLLFRAGWVVKCSPVYTCDTFKTINDPNGWDKGIEFEENIDERDEGDKNWVFENLRGIYVVARHADTKDQYSTFVGKKVIEKLRLNSPNQRANQWSKPADKARLDSGFPIGIWADWYVEMAQAKAIKKLAKILPIGDSRASLALVVDDKAEIGQRVDYNKTAESGVVIDIEEMEAKPIKKSKSSVDSLVGGAVETIIEPKPVPVEQSIIQEPAQQDPDYSDMPTDLPPIEGTMPIPELVPEPVKNGLVTPTEPITPDFLNQHQEWRNKIMQWRSKLDFTQGLNEMPPKIKADEDIKKFLKTRQDFCMQNYPDIW